MGLGKIFGRSSNSSPSSPLRPQGNSRPPQSPGSSKEDYDYGINSPGSSTSKWPPQSSYRLDNDAPPAYSPKEDPDHNNWATDSKMPVPQKADTDAVKFPTPDEPQPKMHVEDPLLALKKYDIVLILDDSFSMMIADGPNRRTRWDQAWDSLHTLVTVGLKYDTNGIDIHLLNAQQHDRKVKTVGDLQGLRKDIGKLSKESHTPTGDVLDSLLLQYRRGTGERPSESKVKKCVIIVITDGAASDSPDEGIINAANFYQKYSFPADQLGIQFFQVGNDREAGKFLDALDRDLIKRMGDHPRDIVDTVKSGGGALTGDTLIKVMLGGINRKQDVLREEMRERLRER